MGVLPAHAGMVPGRPGRRWRLPRAPRARGDGPRQGGAITQNALVLPAHAGMVPPSASASTSSSGAPRARGDGPTDAFEQVRILPCSPRTRGWSPDAKVVRDLVYVLPAHAGMVLRRLLACIRTACAPRARGDGPHGGRPRDIALKCSPRTRGWSRMSALVRWAQSVLPAHAGMVPPRAGRHRSPPCAPRARGDGPSFRRLTTWSDLCSPRTRGWSRDRVAGSNAALVLPAHAGMVPRRCAPRPRGTSAPRARGDGPSTHALWTRTGRCSPRTRGWSLSQICDKINRDVVRCVPCARGDGPAGACTPTGM